MDEQRQMAGEEQSVATGQQMGNGGAEPTVPPVQPGYENLTPPVPPQVGSPIPPQGQSGYGVPPAQPYMQSGYGVPPVQPGYGNPVPPQTTPGYGTPMQPGYGMPSQGQIPYQITSPYGYGGGSTVSSSLAIASMVLGIVSIILCSWYIVGLGCGIAGLVLGCVYRAKGGTNGMSIAGIVCGSVGLALGLLMMFELMIELL